jgi:hypothetical protein
MKILCECCGFFFCKKCASQKTTIPSYKITNPVNVCKYCHNAITTHDFDNYFLSESILQYEKQFYPLAKWEKDLKALEYIPSIKYCILELSNSIPDTWLEIFQLVETSVKGIWITPEDQANCYELTIYRISELRKLVQHLPSFEQLLGNCYNYFLKCYFSLKVDLFEDFFHQSEDEFSIISVAQFYPYAYNQLKKFYSQIAKALISGIDVVSCKKFLAELHREISNCYSPPLEPLQFRLNILCGLVNNIVERPAKNQVLNFDSEFVNINIMLKSVTEIIPPNIDVARIIFRDYLILRVILNYYVNKLERSNIPLPANTNSMSRVVKEKIEILLIKFPELIRIKQKFERDEPNQNIIRNDDIVEAAQKKLQILEDQMFSL